MQAEQEFGVREVFSHVIGDMAKAISERSGEGKLEQFIRARVAAAMIVDLEPRDVMQVMLAGHCVMFHEVMTDSVHETLRGELDTMRHGTRSNIVAMNKAFHINLDRLDRYQTHDAGTRGGAFEDLAPETETTQTSPSPDPVPPETAVPPLARPAQVSPDARSAAPAEAASIRPPHETATARDATPATQRALNTGNGGSPPQDQAKTLAASAARDANSAAQRVLDGGSADILVAGAATSGVATTRPASASVSSPAR